MGIKIGVVSSYPPTHCGIATFTSSLASSIKQTGDHEICIVRLLDSPEEDPNSEQGEVASFIIPADTQSIRRAVRLLNKQDVVLLQHEFGIYGGPDGSDAVTILKGLKVPTIVVLHTVLPNPTKDQRAVFSKICSLATAVVTMSETARTQVITNYLLEPDKVHCIPHGARSAPVVKYEEIGPTPTILTWGLLGPGKGIEWAVQAMSKIKGLDCSPKYIVAGRTHPKVLKREGEVYRDKLRSMIEELGLTDCVELRGEYMSAATLDDLVSSAAIVLLPYDSTDQATSGVLVEAVAAGRPVIATGFPHAKELLATGAGVVVSHKDPKAIARAVVRILQQPGLAKKMSRKATSISSGLLWSEVAAAYILLATSLIKVS